MTQKQVTSRYEKFLNTHPDLKDLRPKISTIRNSINMKKCSKEEALNKHFPPAFMQKLFELKVSPKFLHTQMLRCKGLTLADVEQFFLTRKQEVDKAIVPDAVSTQSPVTALRTAELDLYLRNRGEYVSKTEKKFLDELDRRITSEAKTISFPNLLKALETLTKIGSISDKRKSVGLPGDTVPPVAVHVNLGNYQPKDFREKFEEKAINLTVEKRQAARQIPHEQQAFIVNPNNSIQIEEVEIDFEEL